jgi:putative transcriptional regulator
MRHPQAATLRAYVDGDLEHTRRLLTEAHLALCPMCARVAADRRKPGAGLPAATLSDELYLPTFDRVWTAVEQVTEARRHPAAAVLPPALLTALPPPREWRWLALWSRKVKLAVLCRDPETASRLYLSYYAPGSRFPRHRHVGLEESVILAGGYQNGDHHVERGDWVIGAPGTEHTPTTGPDEECWCLSHVERAGVRFRGWRGLAQRLVSLWRARSRPAVNDTPRPAVAARRRRAPYP